MFSRLKHPTSKPRNPPRSPNLTDPTATPHPNNRFTCTTTVSLSDWVRRIPPLGRGLHTGAYPKPVYPHFLVRQPMCRPFSSLLFIPLCNLCCRIAKTSQLFFSPSTTHCFALCYTITRSPSLFNTQPLSFNHF